MRDLFGSWIRNKSLVDESFDSSLDGLKGGKRKIGRPKSYQSRRRRTGTGGKRDSGRHLCAESVNRESHGVPCTFRTPRRFWPTSRWTPRPGGRCRCVQSRGSRDTSGKRNTAHVWAHCGCGHPLLTLCVQNQVLGTLCSCPQT